jgi:hypothetical protein
VIFIGTFFQLVLMVAVSSTTRRPDRCPLPRRGSRASSGAVMPRRRRAADHRDLRLVLGGRGPSSWPSSAGLRIGHMIMVSQRLLGLPASS